MLTRARPRNIRSLFSRKRGLVRNNVVRIFSSHFFRVDPKAESLVGWGPPVTSQPLFTVRLGTTFCIVPEKREQVYSPVDIQGNILTILSVFYHGCLHGITSSYMDQRDRHAAHHRILLLPWGAIFPSNGW